MSGFSLSALRQSNSISSLSAASGLLQLAHEIFETVVADSCAAFHSALDDRIAYVD